MNLSREELIEQLIHHGHSMNELQNMQSEALKDLFTRETMELIRLFPSYLKEEEEEEENPSLPSPLSGIAPLSLKEFWQKIKENSKNPDSLYLVLDELVHTHDYQDILELLANHTTDQLYKRLARMVKIKYREYQEWLLDDIQRHYRELPPEELAVQMHEYERQRENIHRLKTVLLTLKNPHRKEQIIHLAKMKNDLLKQYRRDEIEGYYREFYENSEEKKGIITKIMKVTNAYTAEKLKTMKVEELEEMYAILLETMAQERRERAKLKHFLKLFEESIYQDSEEVFDNLCHHALVELSDEQMRKVVEFMEGMNSLFAQKLKNLLREVSRR